jgi:hypothetical protein
VDSCEDLREVSVFFGGDEVVAAIPCWPEDKVVVLELVEVFLDKL